MIPNAGTGISSFRLDGAPVTDTWTVHPSESAYSYIYLDVNEGYHTLTSDSGFNALAYGFASAESYGYSAGANVKDLYQFMSVRNQYATVNFPAGCKKLSFVFFNNLSVSARADTMDFWYSFECNGHFRHDNCRSHL
jgi:hypothetical protein